MKGATLTRRKFLQTPEEFATRSRILATTLNELIRRHIHVETFQGLDLGCQSGALTDMLESLPDFKWWGVDPIIEEPILSPKGAKLLPGWAHQLSFPDSYFDCVVLANVYEHVSPEQRTPSLAEIHRVLDKGGILVGQLPNPYFPIEAHTRLPFMGWLPRKLQRLYLRLSPVPWKSVEPGFYVVSIKEMRRRAERLGFETVAIRNFNYPAEAIPQALRWAVRLAKPAMFIMPWSWQFVFRKK
jgi:SAM-dependent methyltransferase